MKNKKILFAILVFFLPLLLRGFWFYQGIYIDRSRFSDIHFDDITEPLPSIAPQDNGFANLEQGPPSIILIDDAHHNYFTMVEIDALVSNLIARNAQVLIAGSRAEFMDGLKKADAILTIAPSEDFTNEEVEALEEFTQRGGRLVAFSDPTHPDTQYIKTREKAVSTVNDMLQPFTISFNNDYLYNLENNEGNFRNIFLEAQASEEITDGIESLVFYGARSIATGGINLAVGLGATFSSLTDTQGVFSPLVFDESNNVLAIGDVTFLASPFNEVADNYTLIENIGEYMTGGDRNRNFKDWPYLFTHNINIQFTDDIKLDDDLLAVIADIQQQFAQDDLEISIGSDLEGKTDTVILGLYPPAGELVGILDVIGFSYPGLSNAKPTPTATSSAPDNQEEVEAVDRPAPNGTNNIIVPEFGEIPPKGFGFIFLDNSTDNRRLIFLADSQDNCVNLLKLLIAKDLDGCLVGNNTAVCDQDISPISKSVKTATPTPTGGAEEIEAAQNGPTDQPSPTETPSPTSTP